MDDMRCGQRTDRRADRRAIAGAEPSRAEGAGHEVHPHRQRGQQCACDCGGQSAPNASTAAATIRDHADVFIGPPSIIGTSRCSD